MSAPFVIVDYPAMMGDDCRIMQVLATGLSPTFELTVLLGSSIHISPLLRCLAGVRIGKNNHTRRVTMQKVSTTDRTDLALSKESRSRDGAEPLLHDPAVVMRLAEESLSSPATTEQKGPERRAFVFHSLRSQKNVQIVAC
jgi:hypothetical protein